MNTGKFKGGFCDCWAVGKVMPNGEIRKVSPICFRKRNAENYLFSLRNKKPSETFRLCHTTNWMEVSR